MGNSIVRACLGTTTTDEQSGGGDKGPRTGSQNTGTTGGGNTSQGAENLTPENSLQKWNRLQASGELDSLSDAEYYELATAANATEKFYFGTQTPETLPFSMTILGMQVARNGVASANRYNEQAQSLGARVSETNMRIAATAGQNSIRDYQRTDSLIPEGLRIDTMAALIAGLEPHPYGGIIEPDTVFNTGQPGPWREGYVFEQSPHVYEEFPLLGATTQAVAGTGLLAEGVKRGPDAISIGYAATRNSNINYIAEVYGTSPNVTLSGNAEQLMNSTELVRNLNKVGTGFAEATGVLGVGLSGLSAYDYYQDIGGTGAQQNIYNAKVVVDFGMLGLGAAFPPLGITYGVTDFGLSFLPDYTAKFGPYSGEVIKGGWHNLYQRDVDRYVEMLNRGEEPIVPPSIYHF